MIPYFATRPEKYPATPKNAAWPERNDAGITENEIERQREQRQDRGVFEDQVFAREQPDRCESENPERDFERRPARAAR